MDTKILKEIKNLSELLQDSTIYENLIRKVEKMNFPFIQAGILGSSNVGKSTFINKLLPDTVALPVSSVPSGINIHIYPAKENYYILAGEKIVLNDSDKLTFNDEKNIEVYSDNKWLIGNNLSIKEIQDIALDETSTDQDIANCLCDTNVCVYILDAFMPLSKQDAIILSALNKFEIPTFVVVSKFDKLIEEQQKDVRQYLDSQLAKFPSVKYSENESLKPFSEISTFIKKFIESEIKSIDFSQLKAKYETLFLDDAITKFRAMCQIKIDENEKNKQKVIDNTQKKYDKINSLETEWMRIEVALSERRQKTNNRIREKLDSKAEDMLRRLSHDIEVSNDIKQYWDKELSYRLDDMMRSETQTLLQIINGDIVNNLKWLQEEVMKSFKFQTSMLPFISVTLDNKEIALEDLELANNQKLKVVTRVGTAATVVCAGVLVATAGIGGIVMAVGVLSGIGAEFFMKHKNKESRQKVLDILPSVIDRAELEYVSKVSQSLKSAYDEILANLKQLHQNWKEKAIKEIEEEKLIALHNLVSNQWSDCLNKINELSNR